MLYILIVFCLTTREPPATPLFVQCGGILSGKLTRLNEKSFSLYCNFSCEHKTIIFMPLDFHCLFRCDIIPCCPEQGVPLHPNTQNPPFLRQLNVQSPARCFSPNVDEACKDCSPKTRLAEVNSDHPLDLEEATQPPDLEEGFTNDDADDEEVPPLDSGVCALGGVAVGALADDDVLLLVLDLGKEIG